MKAFNLYAVVAINILGVGAIESLSKYIDLIPSCSYSALKKAMSNNECSTSDIEASTLDCLCDHLSDISVTVAGAVDSHCASNFLQSIGSACGVWLAEGTAATDLGAAETILASELGGNAGSGSKPTGSKSTAGATAADSTPTPTDNAAAHTLVPGAIGLVGGAAAAFAGYIM